MKALFLALLTSGSCAVTARSVVAQPTPGGLGAVVHQQVIDLLQGDGGTRADMVLVAADSATAALLRLADVRAVAAPGPQGLICPGSTEADGRRSESPVGYVMQVTLTAGADTTTRELRITKKCGLRLRGSVRPFAEGGAWAFRREGGRWRVTARLYLWET